MTRPTWVEISRRKLRRNFRLIADMVAPAAEVMAVVKCDAYGHGAVECARVLQEEGATWFGVTCAAEGVALRHAGIGGRIVLLSGFWRGEEDVVAESRLIPVIWDAEHIRVLDRAARDAGLVELPVHAKVNTGMARLGADEPEIAPVIEALHKAKHVELEGLMTHLASSDVLDATEVERQLHRFAAAVEQFNRAGLAPMYQHVANSSAIAGRPHAWHNLVRPGISLYGYCLPFTTESGRLPDKKELAVEPVLAWKSRVISLRDVPAGQALGYSAAYVTPNAAKIAALPAGYGDGLNRRLSSRGRVLIRGEYAPIVGNVSMDLTLIDVTAIAGVSIGDEVTLIGEQIGKELDAWEHARLADTIPYEILCNISKRVPRVYVE